MHITLESDYAVRIVDCLASADSRMDARSIAEATCVSLRFSLKILRKLAASGIVASFKGSRGGYELARSPADISLKDVIETVEGKYFFSRCLDEKHGCNRGMEDSCRFRKAFEDISAKVEAMLAAYTFDMFTDT